MLRELYINNYLLVPELRLRLGDGMTVITGETGAGKSIIAGSIGLIFGDSAANLEAFDKKRPIYLEAVFEISKNPELQEILSEINADNDSELILAREISISGKSSYFIGGRRVTATVIKSLRDLLVDFHNQRDQQKILSPSYQLDILDRFADTRELRENFGHKYKEIKRLRQLLEDKERKQEEYKQRLELYRYQYEELQKADLKPGEYQDLQKEYELISHSMAILDLGHSIIQDLFEGENSVFDRLAHYKAKLQEYCELNDHISNAAESLVEAMESLRSVSEHLDGLIESLNYDPDRLTQLERRLDEINALLHKHKVKTVDELQQIVTEREQELQKAEDFELEIANIREQLKQRMHDLQKTAESLTEKRNNAARELSASLQASIRQIAMKDARFQIEIDKIHKNQNLQTDLLSAYSETGQDSVNFLFSGNIGMSLNSLSSVASGGEMSRILLGVKEVLAAKESPRLLILDEIDAGIGGRTAQSVAKCIKKISQKHPVLCISHLPQIAAVSDTHIAVEKTSDKKAIVSLRILNNEERTQELARMLSGKITEASLKHAEELITNRIRG
nr:repair protein RecN [Candidatus Cloacimonadota bacterium]